MRARPAAFLFGWTELLFNRPGSMAALSVAFVGSLMFSQDREVSDGAQVILASVVILGVAWVNIIDDSRRLAIASSRASCRRSSATRKRNR